MEMKFTKVAIETIDDSELDVIVGGLVICPP